MDPTDQAIWQEEIKQYV